MAGGNWQELNSAAQLCARSSDNVHAEELWIKALEQLRKRGIEDENILLVLDNLARHYVRTGAYVHAGKTMQRALEVSRRISGDDSAAAAKVLMDLGDLLIAQGEDEKAEAFLMEAMAIWTKRLGGTHFEVGRCLKRLAAVDKDAGRYAEAEQKLRDALPIYEKSFDSKHAEIARLYNEMAMVCMFQEKYDVAEVLFLRQFEIWKQATNSKRPDIAKSLNDLAIFHYNRKQSAKAEKAARKALSISVSALGDKNLQAARGHNIIGICLATAGRHKEAQEAFQSALAIIQGLHGDDHPLAKEIWDNLTHAAGEEKRLRRT